MALQFQDPNMLSLTSFEAVHHYVTTNFRVSAQQQHITRFHNALLLVHGFYDTSMRLCESVACSTCTNQSTGKDLCAGHVCDSWWDLKWLARISSVGFDCLILAPTRARGSEIGVVCLWYWYLPCIEESAPSDWYLNPCFCDVRSCNVLHLAQVPMSPWARTSALDEWLESKVH